MNINQFKVDGDKAKGVWVQFEDASFLIAYGNGKAFVEASARIGKRYPQHRLKSDPNLLQAMTAEIIADCVLLDWKGLEADGQPFPCTPENKAKLLQIDTFREFIASEARDLANFQSEATAEDAATLKSGGGMGAEVG